mmetsp:Transcript_25956/g.39888  ORF Transcript_25956/g.39888 Transcript_25956/m.39888 type:complete len:81 (-) Transcript_25956:1-243(-)
MKASIPNGDFGILGSVDDDSVDGDKGKTFVVFFFFVISVMVLGGSHDGISYCTDNEPRGGRRRTRLVQLAGERNQLPRKM